MTNDTDAQSAENAALEAQEWKATLHFDGVVGFNRPVELFQYTERFKYTGTRKKSRSFNPIVRFDPIKYPPTKEGCAKLMAEMKDIALREGSLLVHRNNPRELCCFRCRLYTSHQKRERPQQPENSAEDGTESASSASNEKVQGSPNKPRRVNKKGELDGRSKWRSVTTLPTSKDEVCKVMIRIDTVEGPDGFIFLRQGCGGNTHKFHPKPLPGELVRPCRGQPLEKKRLTQSFIEAQQHLNSISDNNKKEEDGGEGDVGRVDNSNAGGSGVGRVDNGDARAGGGFIGGGEHVFHNNVETGDTVTVDDAGDGVAVDDMGNGVAVDDVGDGAAVDDAGDGVTVDDADGGDREGGAGNDSEGGDNEWLSETNNHFFSGTRTAWITDEHLVDYFKEIIPLYGDQRSRKRLIDLITKDAKEQIS